MRTADLSTATMPRDTTRPMPWSDAVRVWSHPAGAYAELSRGPAGGRFLELPVLSALLLGVVFAVADSNRPSAWLVAGCAVAWSFVPALQIASVAATWLAFARGRLGLRSAIHLHFLGHLPWSVWLLLVAAVASATPPPDEARLWKLIFATAAVPFLWSRAIGWQFFRRVYGLGGRGALLATLLHLVMVLGPIAVFFLVTGQLAPRLLGAR
jgi:hypothetical protein